MIRIALAMPIVHSRSRRVVCASVLTRMATGKITAFDLASLLGNWVSRGPELTACAGGLLHLPSEAWASEG